VAGGLPLLICGVTVGGLRWAAEWPAILEGQPLGQGLEGVRYSVLHVLSAVGLLLHEINSRNMYSIMHYIGKSPLSERHLSETGKLHFFSFFSSRIILMKL
jgi:hypothetical protein